MGIDTRIMLPGSLVQKLLNYDIWPIIAIIWLIGLIMHVSQYWYMNLNINSDAYRVCTMNIDTAQYIFLYDKNGLIQYIGYVSFYTASFLTDFGSHIGFMLIRDGHTYMAYAVSYSLAIKRGYRHQKYASKWFG